MANSATRVLTGDNFVDCFILDETDCFKLESHLLQPPRSRSLQSPCPTHLFDSIPIRKNIDHAISHEELDDALLNDLDEESFLLTFETAALFWDILLADVQQRSTR